jgi:hypothetical protein
MPSHSWRAFFMLAFIVCIMYTLYMTKYLVFDIGCLECGEGSTVIGFYDTRVEADKAREDYLEPGTRWGKAEWIGQHSVEVFEVTI